MTSKRDYYDILGVNKQATAPEIKSAYRKLAIKWHPDKNQDKQEAEKKFKEINEAYEILSNTEKKKTYDQFGHAAFDPSMGGNPYSQAGRQSGPFTYSYSSGGQGVNVEDLFGGSGYSDPFQVFQDFFGGRRQAKPHYSMKIEFMDAVNGVEKTIVHQGKQHTIKVPPGADDGTRIRFNEFDISINVKTHPDFKRNNYDIYLEKEIPFTTAILGGNITVPTLDKDLKLKIRPGTQPNTSIRLSGKGIKHLRSNRHGDFYIRLIITLPTRLTRAQKQALQCFN
ncbi:DnaJ domain-containing protein [Patescibacteria group bacterium]|nr:DnaJ domain-containing protein [Patescibacteria group bacterium]MBU1256629.1 DnaJ domain-containing protein [Patescibacteria group bacterium]MBU1457815.1 DnaJ domain-containing protein [Patescibacteria group bacterium]